MYSYQQQQQYSPPPPAGQYAQQQAPQYGSPPPAGYTSGSGYAGPSSSSSPPPLQQQQGGGYAGQHQAYAHQQPRYDSPVSPQQPVPYGTPAPGYGYGQSQQPAYGSTSQYPQYSASPMPPYQQQQQPQPVATAPAPYHHQPPPQSYQQQPAYSPPQPQAGPSSLPYNLGSDPNVFRGYFSHELKQLTFNSKPIINGLTILAHENATRMAPVVCQCLEEHIKQTHPTTKLPALYLLDSICKNIGPPYTSLFSRTIDRIFLAAYHDVDPPTQVKMEELLGTWRTGGQDGGELFKLPPNAPLGTRPAQRTIEEALFGRPPPPPVPAATPMSPYQNGTSNFSQQQTQQPPFPSNGPARQETPPVHSGTNNVEKAAVLYDIRKLLELRRSQLVANPSNRSNYDQINTLKELELLVTKTTFDASQIALIRAQLAKINPPAVPQSQSPVNAFDQRSGKRQRLMSPPMQHQLPKREISPPSSAFPSLGSTADLAALASRLNPDIIRTASAQGARLSASPPPNLPTSGHALHLSGSVTATSPLANFSQGAPNPPTAVPTDNSAQLKAIDDNAHAAYEHHRLHYTVQLQSGDIARYRPGAHALLYEAMPLRCQQCGNRYLDCPLGKERLDKDLDRHVRISRRYTEGTGAQRGIARAWFTLEEEWVLPPSKLQLSSAAIQAESAKKEAQGTAELLAKFVLVPEGAATDEELGTCPICKEAFKNEFSQEEEDWVWRNCIELDGKYYHATCKAEHSE